MSGCFGNSAYDRHLEAETDRYCSEGAEFEIWADEAWMYCGITSETYEKNEEKIEEYLYKMFEEGKTVKEAGAAIKKKYREKD